jgi:hypothetical protein
MRPESPNNKSQGYSFEGCHPKSDQWRRSMTAGSMASAATHQLPGHDIFRLCTPQSEDPHESGLRELTHFGQIPKATARPSWPAMSDMQQFS